LNKLSSKVRKKELTKEQKNEIETRKTIEKVNETQCCFFKKTNKSDKPLAGLRRKKSEQL